MALRLVIRRLSVGNAACRRKLLKAFHNEKKQQFDISKVPDIYDSAKYDAIHNSELGLNLKQLYTVSSQLRVHPTSDVSNISSSHCFEQGLGTLSAGAVLRSQGAADVLSLFHVQC